MVNKAQTIIGVGEIEKGGIEVFSQKEKMGNVIALNVLPYLTADEKIFFIKCLVA